ncbi:SUN domain-containing protein 2 [Cavenderia fasciculata]|uniref:SUN domain-containing protein 2 n=1 Tax=Cavenderia fasciculata TaxID=261658 RepID=F4PTG8_CACFS|nr:SUN domain-containing protein 2 [Cavenderia fasciculata]EGG20850.1 SUN domain-containing protein 2 [Cavenderia fasciculata]|eukprot:XP_004358700.1 SUN domain-containing protein 2 [Cavenderia fasciculata]
MTHRQKQHRQLGSSRLSLLLVLVVGLLFVAYTSQWHPFVDASTTPLSDSELSDTSIIQDNNNNNNPIQQQQQQIDDTPETIAPLNPDDESHRKQQQQQDPPPPPPPTKKEEEQKDKIIDDITYEEEEEEEEEGEIELNTDTTGIIQDEVTTQPEQQEKESTNNNNDNDNNNDINQLEEEKKPTKTIEPTTNNKELDKKKEEEQTTTKINDDQIEKNKEEITSTKELLEKEEKDKPIIDDTTPKGNEKDGTTTTSQPITDNNTVEKKEPIIGENEEEPTTNNKNEQDQNTGRPMTNITTVIEEVHKQIERERLENELKERKAQKAEQLAQQQILTISDKDDEEEDQHNPIINDTYPTTPLPKKPEDLPNQFNYASAECGATVLATNREAREVSSILHSSKDRYMLNECGTDQWFVIELCEEIGIQIIELANYEFFSSMFKTFTVYGSQQYPSMQWDSLGNFTANNVRKPQYFALKEKYWYKYIKIKFLTHYGNQVYCPISDIKVYGSTMVEDLKAGMENDINMQKIIEEQLHGKLHYHGTPGTVGGSASISNKGDSTNQNFETTAGMLKNLIDIFKKTQKQQPVFYHPPPQTTTSATEEEDQISQITEMYEQQSQKNPESIFKTLANRVKSLEINQSISNRYLEKLEAFYSETIQSIRDDFNRLSEFFEKMAYLGADLEKRIAREKEEVEVKIARDFSKEINYLRERIIRMEQKNEDDKNYYLMLLLATVIGTVFLSYMISKSNNIVATTIGTSSAVLSQAYEHVLSPKFSLKHNRRNSLNVNQTYQQHQQNGVQSSSSSLSNSITSPPIMSNGSGDHFHHKESNGHLHSLPLLDVSLSSSSTPPIYQNNDNNNNGGYNRKKKKKNKQY